MKYPWKRFWCPRNGMINLSDDGFLVDPESESSKWVLSDVMPFEQIADKPCLALLGEPGIGKSNAMEDLRTALEESLTSSNNKIMSFNLNEYGDESRLIREVFECETFAVWQNGTHILHLFLDSLDECRIQIPQVASILVSRLGQIGSQLPRLRLRIACRTADWPTTLEQSLPDLWGEENFRAFELSPLRRKDIEVAAELRGINTEKFFAELNRTESVPLAIKPITLGFLLSMFETYGRFPNTRAELYESGCRLLCEESNISRQDLRSIGGTGRLSAEQRLIVASRIAAISIFCKKPTVHTGLPSSMPLVEEVNISALAGGNEGSNLESLNISEDHVREALGTGLFSSRGAYRMGFAHQTYAEFLAALYLRKNELTLTQIISLIGHPEDPEKKLVPQLHETAAWSASMLPDVFKEIMEKEPEVLLRSDVTTADEKDRAELVERLLYLHEQERLHIHEMQVRDRYKKLAHKGLEHQLKPYIQDPTKGLAVRRVAIDVAEACSLSGLQDELLSVVLDSAQPLPIRVEAGYAVVRIADNVTKSKLKDLAISENSEDIDDELKGLALRAVWPNEISTAEMFSSITSPKQPSLIGAYHMFLGYEIHEKLPLSDIPLALEWAEKQDRRHQLSYSFEQLTDNIVLKAWGNLDSPGVLDAFAKAAFSRLKMHDEIVMDNSDKGFRIQSTSHDEKRRMVLNAIIPQLSDPEKEVFWLAYSRTPIVLSRDVEWMIERLKASENEDEQFAWACLIGAVFDIRKIDHIHAVTEVCQHNMPLSKKFTELIEPVDLHSDRAKQMKAEFLKREKLMDERKERPLLDPPPSMRVVRLLDEFESGNLNAWWHLNMEITLEPDSQFYEHEYETDITSMPGWEKADSKTRLRILKAAKQYLLEQDCNKDKWLGKDIFYRPAVAGYRALLLLLKEDPGFIYSLKEEIWKKWASIVLKIVGTSSTEDKEHKEELLKLTYRYAPSEIIKTLIVLIDRENEKHGRVYIIDRIEKHWDEQLAIAMLNKANDRRLKPQSLGTLLRTLLRHEVADAKTFAESILFSFHSSCQEERSRALGAACALMTETDDSSWVVLWPIFELANQFGRDVVEYLTAHFRDISFGKLLSEEQLADFFVWLVRQYPYSEYPKHNGSDLSGSRDGVVDLKNSILRRLKESGTYPACKALQRISREFPELDWLKWTILEAQVIARRKTWTPPNPAHIIRLAANKQFRFVQSGGQLLEAVIESLRRLEGKLQGETPSSRDIWDRAGDKYCPIEEEAFSDYVKRHLDEDLVPRGVIVNREVRIHRGERTDLHVQAITKSPSGETYDFLTAIIEVKGCWHRELNKAMETQLVGRYLKNNRCQHGLYLVGWFNCDQWDDSDYKKEQVPKITIEEAQKQFDSQAADLSQQGVQIKAVVMNTAIK